MQSQDGNHLWGPGPSLWNLITKHVHGPELPKLRTAVGQSLVDAYTDIHTEAEMYHKMCQEIQQNGNHASRAGAPLQHQQGSPLPDPPAVKELLRAEVKMLLQTLRETASREARDGEELLLRYNPKAVNYALGHPESCYTNCTNSGNTDNESRTSSRCSVQSCNEDEIEAVRDKLNVTGVDQVVDRLRSVLMEECDMLKRLVRDLKENINQQHRSKTELNKSEPSLIELRELREAVQRDLELYTSSFAASPTASPLLPVKELKNRFRRAAGQRASDETVQALTAASLLKPHPPPSLCHTNPRPPYGPPVTKTSASVKPIHTSSFSESHGQHRSTSAASKSSKIPVCTKITTSEQANSHVTAEQIMQRGNDCSLYLEKDSVQIKSQRMSPAPEAHLSSLPIIQSTEFDLSLQRKAKGSVRRSRSINPSHIPALSSLCDAGCYSSNSSGHSTSTAGKSNTQNGKQKSARGCSSVSTGQTAKDRIKSSSDSFYSSAPSETGCPPSLNGSRKSSSGVDGNENAHLGKDVNQEESLRSHCLADHSPHHSEGADEWGPGNYSQPVCLQIQGQLFTSPKRPLGTKSVQETKTELEVINKFFQPVPPARVST